MTKHPPIAPLAPAAVNKFDTEARAIEAAKAWSKDRRETWSVIHAPAASLGLMFFVERGDGGMICTATERFVGSWTNGKKD